MCVASHTQWIEPVLDAHPGPTVDSDRNTGQLHPRVDRYRTRSSERGSPPWSLRPDRNRLGCGCRRCTTTHTNTHIHPHIHPHTPIPYIYFLANPYRSRMSSRHALPPKPRPKLIASSASTGRREALPNTVSIKTNSKNNLEGNVLFENLYL